MDQKSSVRGDAQHSAVSDGMRIERDVPIAMDDGVVLRADVFRPVRQGKHPSLITYGPYAKGLSFQEYFKRQWDQMIAQFPEVAQGTSNKYQNWEVVDPEKWVPDGYVCIRVDSRGAGRSPGYLDAHSPREAKDFHDCIEWAAAQAWSNGKVGINGISYYAVNQWRVAGLQPPHLAGICVWEGYADRYRDATHHGGILSTFPRDFQPKQILRVQHGVGERGPRDSNTGEYVAGPATLSEDQLARNRAKQWQELLDHPLDGPYYRDRSAHWEDIVAPLLSSGNWGGHGLHLRGNIEGYVRAASKQKWLEVHGHAHWTHFYTDYGIELQKRFFGHFLKGEDTGWSRQPAVQLQIRHPGEKYVLRHENEWPLARTAWTRFYLDPAGLRLSREPAPAATQLGFDALGDGITFMMAPLREPMEITGPVAAKLSVSSSTRDADIFLVLRVFDPAGKEVLFHGANDPGMPVAMGWLRASHRKLDRELTLAYRPYHSHDESWPLKPGEVVDLDVEIWPTCIVVPAGYSIGLSVRGKDYENDLDPVPSPWGGQMRGAGPFQHGEPADRPAELFGGRTTLHFDGERRPCVLLPVIPPA
jgi:predicted acyl esterase